MKELFEGLELRMKRHESPALEPSVQSTHDHDSSQSRYPPLPRTLSRVAANPAQTVVVVSIFMLLYQACLPYGLTLSNPSQTFDWRVFPSANFDVSRTDIIANVILCWVFGHFVFVASWRNHRRWARAVLVTVVGTLAMASTMEVIQLFNPVRISAIWDVISSAIGSSIALVTGAIYCLVVADPLAKWLRAETARRPAGVAATAAATFILLDAARPFYVISSANLLFDNIKRSNLIPFRPPGADIRDQLQIAFGSHVPQPLAPVERTLDYWASQLEMLVLALCLFGLLAYARRGRALGSALAVGMCVMIGAQLVRLGIVGGRMDVTYLVVAMLSVPLALLSARMFERRQAMGLVALAVLCIGYVVLSDLRPFELGVAQALHLRVFTPLIHIYLSTDVTKLWEIAESVLKFVPAGAALYALRLYWSPKESLEAWPRVWPPMLLCGLVALSLEIVQFWLPARTPHIDDVLLAVLGGLVGASCVRLLAAYSSGPVRT